MTHIPRFWPLLAVLVMLCAAISAAEPGARPIRLACVGDSITQGVGTADPGTESYPAQLQAILGSGWEVRNFGVGGRTLLRRQDPYDIRPALEAQPDAVVIMLGTNDSRAQTWERFGSEFSADYTAIIAAFRALPSHPRIWICAPVPMFPGQWGLSEEILIGRAIPAIRAVATATGTPLIDLHTALAGRQADFPDQVHPNAAGYRTIAAAVAKALSADRK